MNMMATSQIGQAAGLIRSSAGGRVPRKVARRSCVTHCSKQQDNDQNLLTRGAQIAASTAAAALLLVQSGPANAFVEDTYKISQKEQQEYERILKERGVKLPELTLPKRAPKPKLEAEGEEAFVPPPPVKLEDRPLKLSAPPRVSTFEINPRVPAPEPIRKAAEVPDSAGTVKIVGGDTPSPPPPKAREPPKPFTLPNPPKPAPAPAPAPKAELPKPSLPELPKPSLPELPKAELPKPDLPKPDLPKPELPSLPVPAPAAETEAPKAPAAESAPAPEAFKPFGGFFSGPKVESKAEEEAGKPELPQQEPAVAPGAAITIPESKDIAPEPKVESPAPATKESPAPFGGFFNVPKTYEQETPKDIPAPTPSTPPAAAQKAEKPESKAAGGDDIFSLINSSTVPKPKPAAAPAPVEPKQDASPSGGQGLPAWGLAGATVAVAVAAFVANAQNAEGVRAAEEEAKKAAEKTADAVSEKVDADLESSPAKKD